MLIIPELAKSFIINRHEFGAIIDYGASRAFQSRQLRCGETFSISDEEKQHAMKFVNTCSIQSDLQFPRSGAQADVASRRKRAGRAQLGHDSRSILRS